MKIPELLQYWLNQTLGRQPWFWLWLWQFLFDPYLWSGLWYLAVGWAAQSSKCQQLFFECMGHQYQTMGKSVEIFVCHLDIWFLYCKPEVVSKCWCGSPDLYPHTGSTALEGHLWWQRCHQCNCLHKFLPHSWQSENAKFTW